VSVGRARARRSSWTAAPPVPQRRSARGRAGPTASLSAVPAHPAVQAKCDDCAREDREEKRTVQARLEVGPAGDRYEQEADAIAGEVMRGAGATAAAPAVQRSDGGGGETIAASDHGLTEGGMPLSGTVRSFFEDRTGRDLSGVRVHEGDGARDLNRSISARAFTYRNHVWLGRGESAGPSFTMAHELAHVMQQTAPGPVGERVSARRIASPAAQSVQRAVVRAGGLSIQVEYDSVINVRAADLPDRLVAAVGAYTGMPPDLIQDSTLRGLSPTAQNWLLFALKLLADNRGRAPLLVPDVALQRLIDRAPLSSNSPLPDPDDLFVHEVVEFSGWLESALANRLRTPGAGDRKAIDDIVNPDPGKPGDPLDPSFEPRFRAAMEHFLTVLDPGTWKKTGTQSLSAFQTIGDTIQSEARTYFAPYADAAIGNIYSLTPAWHASANIFSTVTMVPTTENRMGHLLNRSEYVGRSTEMSYLVPDPNIFSETKFNPADAAHVTERNRILGEIEKDPKYQPVIDRLVQHTGRKTGSGTATSIGLSTEYNAASLTACQAHWSNVATLCHEVLHGLVHPKFNAAAARMTFPQVLREGFTEVLGVQLFNDHVAKKAKTDKKYKATLEAGVAGAPCKDPKDVTVGYGSAGKGAADILSKVHDNNFRAAYFLGRTELAGLP
jgi:hypothetical protein